MCNIDATLLTEKWTLIVYHISNVHEWDDGESNVFNKFVHSVGEQYIKKWLWSSQKTWCVAKPCCRT